MADVEITLNNSGESVTYRGYVINSCDNSKVDDGSWSPTSATGMTVNASESNITITHNNTSTSDVSSTFTWTSSLVSGCTKTLKVTVLGSANYKFYIHESTLVEISSISVTHKVETNRTYNLNDIVRIPYYYACAESPNDNSVSASSLTVSNFIANKYFSSSSLVVNDNEGEPSGRFYIGVKCNTDALVKLFNDYTAFSATITFNLSYSNASIPVTIDISKDKVTQYKFYHKEFFSLEKISSWSESFTINNYHTYSLNEIIEGQNFSCAKSPNDNSVSASLLTVSNFSSNNSNFTSSSLAINDDDDPSGFFYIGIKCNTNSLVNLFNGNSAFSATMTFDLSYSNASIPVTINIIKNKVETTQYEITFTLVVNISDNLPYTYDSCDSGNISYASINYSFSSVEYSSINGSDSWYNNGNNKFTYSFTISSDVERPTINIDFNVNVYRVNLTTPQYEVRVDNDVSYVNNTVPSNCPFGSIYHFGDAMGISGNVNRVVSNGDTIDVYIRLNGH